MSGRSFTFLDRLDGRGTDPTGARGSIQQPQTRQPIYSQGVPRRDRYRAPRHDAMYDKVEDDGACGLEQPLDAFDERVLQQPHADRHSRAARGQARLSLAPQPSQFVAPDAYLQPNELYRRQADAEYNFDGRHSFSQAVPRRVLSQFSYNPAPAPQESSSDVHFGASSSPAFKAGQRRAENIQASTAHPPANSRHYKEKESVEADYSREEPQPPRPRPSAAVSIPHSEARTGAPTIRGIRQVPVAELPDRLRTVFPYPIFNAVQSKCFDTVYKTDNNFVLSSPTGSGKTVVLELAICRAINTNSTGQYKIVYQAPTKALCSERQRDWQKKFGPLGLNCVELTGDSDAGDLRNVQSANIIVTTPEKWDSITRKWKDHEKLMRLVNLFLIDEVHLLKEQRGAILEAVVSRMKSIGTGVRFVALSATVPNFHDVATWLGKNAAEPYEPAVNEKFGEDFRPVRLRKHVCGYQSNVTNDFAFEKLLDAKLPEVVKNYSEGKPIMVFCFTRNSTIATAKILSNWWVTRHPRDRAWKPPTKELTFKDRKLRDCAASGVAFHHAGIDAEDRIKIEKAYLEGELSVICCTSTLAVGVNLPCHLVVIKNTVGFTQGGIQEYSDLEIMQMLGRAGRPQFDDSATAVIMTRQNKVHKYELMVTGQEVLESTLHLNLIDHLNAEIGLGTIRDLTSARTWLQSTFLYVRIKQNPGYYKLEGSRSGQSVDEQLDDICSRDILLLRRHDLTTGEQIFRCTEYGYAMAQYYVHFDTMRIFMGLPPKATISELLSAIAQASEFETIRFRAGEKPLYKNINKSPFIRFPIPINLDLPAHKVSLLIQSVLGAADISWDGEFAKHRGQYHTEAIIIFKHINRLIHCIIDCQIYAGDSVSINNALLLGRSLAARVWDDSPIQMKQIDTLGVVACRKLAQAGIRSLEELECTDAHRIERILGRNPPYGLSILEKLKGFPKLRVSLQLQPSSVAKTAEGVKITVKADIGFINEKVPETFGSKVVYVCLLAETSDGRKVHFARLSAKKLGKGQSLTIPTILRAPNLSINCYIMCDAIAGTMRSASVTPKVSATMFPPAIPEPTPSHELERPTSNMSRRRAEISAGSSKFAAEKDEFDDDGIDDEELVKASSKDLDFDHIDNYANPTDAITRKNTARNSSAKHKEHAKQPTKVSDKDNQEPRQLENGKWACNHACKDKEACKHLCCKEGMEKPPRKVAQKRFPSNEKRTIPDDSSSEKTKDTGKKMQTKLQLTASKRKSTNAIEELDLTQQERKKKAKYAIDAPRDFRELNELHKSTQKQDPPPSVSSIMHQYPSYSYVEGGRHQLSFLRETSVSSSDYGDFNFDDMPTSRALPEPSRAPRKAEELSQEMKFDSTTGSRQEDAAFTSGPDFIGDYASMSEAIMLSAADFEAVEGSLEVQNNLPQDPSQSPYGKDDLDYLNDHFEREGFLTQELDMEHPSQSFSSSSPVKVPAMPPQKDRSLFVTDTSSPEPPRIEFKSAKSMLEGSALKGLNHGDKNRPEKPIGPNTPKEKAEENETHSSDDSGKENDEIKPDAVPDAYKDLEPWLFQEFGGIVEIVD